MAHATVQRLTVHATLTEDPRLEIAAATRRAACGDASWQEWLDDRDVERAAIVSLTYSVVVLIEGGERIVRFRAPPAWLERESNTPQVELQVQDLATVRLPGVAAALRAADADDISINDLHRMYAHIELGGRLTRWLAKRAA